MPFFLGVRRTRRLSQKAPLGLPAVGPFAGKTPPPTSGLSDLIVTSDFNPGDMSVAFPLQYRNITISGAGILDGTSNARLIIQCDTLTSAGRSITTVGNGGTDYGSGGGGDGASGGGTGDIFDAGGDGGSRGSDGVDDGFGLPPGTGHGFAFLNTSFIFPFGGIGQTGDPAPNFGIVGGTGGARFAGIAGGGGGGGAGDISSVSAGGGGSGGLICIVARKILGTGSFNSSGGKGGLNSGSPGDDGNGGGGGGGPIYIAARTYSGLWTANSSAGLGGFGGTAGTIQIFAILPNNSLSPKTLSQAWDYS